MTPPLSPRKGSILSPEFGGRIWATVGRISVSEIMKSVLFCSPGFLKFQGILLGSFSISALTLGQSWTRRLAAPVLLSGD